MASSRSTKTISYETDPHTNASFFFPDFMLIMPRVVLCGTHPNQFNGYSKVIFEVIRELAKLPRMQIFIFGFQNYHDIPAHETARKLPANVEVYDAYKNEDPKAKGFGESLIVNYVLEKKPDMVIVYNDLIVLATFMERLKAIQPRTFKIVPYIDIVYRNERTALIKHINDICDGGIMFTKYWEKVIKSQGFDKPTHIMEHGFNNTVYFPVDKPVARAYFNIPDEDFVIVNLNRNQPRKRWDVCLMAFVKFISMHEDPAIKLIVGTALTGGWDLVEIFVHECRKYGLDPEVAKKHLIILQTPQQLTDREVNIMYNAADVGINTCDGEGFGLCNFEQAGVGIPQVVPAIGGFLDFFNENNAILVEPKWSLYVESSRDAVGGEAQMCEVDDFVAGLEQYYSDPELRKTHGANARKNITTNYKWSTMASKLYNVIMHYCPEAPAPVPAITPAPVAAAPAKKLEPVEEEPNAAEDMPNVDVSKLSGEKVLERPKPGLFSEFEVYDAPEPAPAPSVHVTAAAAPAPAPVPTPVAQAEEPSNEDSDDDAIEQIAKMQAQLAKLMAKKKKKAT